MKPENGSSVVEFTLEEFTVDAYLQILLLIIFVLIYVFNLLDNISILVIIRMDPRLHSPMYFFLGSLSILDIGVSSNSTPKMLVDMYSKKKTISFYGCVAQLVFCAGFGSTEFFLLAVMAHDRYVAICHPLQYSMTMTKSLSIRFLTASYIGGFLNSLIDAACIFRLSFCGPDIIEHFMCDYLVLLKLSCTDITINELVHIALAATVMVISLVIVLISYGHILAAVLIIRTAAASHRAFSTCASHFSCVSIFYGAILFTQLRINSLSMQEQDKVVAVFSTVLIPMLNPLIYSLRNKDVKSSLWKLLNRTVFLK